MGWIALGQAFPSLARFHRQHDAGAWRWIPLHVPVPDRTTGTVHLADQGQHGCRQSNQTFSLQ